jgi:hypothetical protein
VSYLDLITAIEATAPRLASEQRPPPGRAHAPDRTPTAAHGTAGPFSPDFTSMQPSPTSQTSAKRRGVAARAAAAAAKHAARLKKSAVASFASRSGATAASYAAATQAPFPKYRDRLAQPPLRSESRGSTPARGSPAPVAAPSIAQPPRPGSSSSRGAWVTTTTWVPGGEAEDPAEGDGATETDDHVAEAVLRSALEGLLVDSGGGGSPLNPGLPGGGGSGARGRSQSRDKPSPLGAEYALVADLAAEAPHRGGNTEQPRPSLSLPPRRRPVSPPREALGSYHYLLHALKSGSKQATAPTWHDAYTAPPSKPRRPWAK